MKYKIIGIIVTVSLLISAFAASVAVTPTMLRVHQHTSSAVLPECTDHGKEKFCTHLPLVQIYTYGQEIPGKAYRSDGKTVYTTTPDGKDRIKAYLTVTDNDEKRNHTDDEPAVSSDILIHVRGHSSRRFDKPGYRIKLVGAEGKNNPQSIMGMDAHSDWVLHGPFLDKTLIRNYMFYNLAGEMMSYAPNVRFCELMLNGEYEGLYVMTETIDAGENGARLPLSVDKKDETYTGYLLRLDRRSEDDIDNFTRYSLRMDDSLGITIEYPGEKNLTPELEKDILQDFSDFEKALYSYDYDDKIYGYKNLIDVDSFVDYLIINELTCNYDAGALSTYIYKNTDGKFCMCVWDFNNACDNYQESAMPVSGFRMIDELWFWMLVKDEDFTQKIVDRYRELRSGLLSNKNLTAYIDDTIEYLGDAVVRNYERWGYVFEDDSVLLSPDYRNPHSYRESVSQLKKFLRQRTNFMDMNIESLKQYSANSKIKKYVENAN